MRSVLISALCVSSSLVLSVKAEIQFNINVGFTDGSYHDFGFTEVSIFDNRETDIAPFGTPSLSSTNTSYPGRKGTYLATHMTDLNKRFLDPFDSSSDKFPLASYAKNPSFNIAYTDSFDKSTSLTSMTIYALPTDFPASGASKWLIGAQINITKNGDAYDICTLSSNSVVCPSGLKVYLKTQELPSIPGSQDSTTNDTGAQKPNSGNLDSKPGVNVEVIGYVIGGLAAAGMVAAGLVIFYRRRYMNNNNAATRLQGGGFGQPGYRVNNYPVGASGMAPQVIVQPSAPRPGNSMAYQL